MGDLLCRPAFEELLSKCTNLPYLRFFPVSTHFRHCDDTVYFSFSPETQIRKAVRRRTGFSSVLRKIVSVAFCRLTCVDPQRTNFRHIADDVVGPPG